MKKKKEEKNRGFLQVSYIFLAAFLLLFLYLIFYMVFQRDEFVNNSYNKRIDAMADYVVRGTITSSDGTVLAYTEVDEEGNETRVYPYGEMFAHVVGFSTNGKLGLESSCNYYLLSSHSSFLEKATNLFQGEKNQGDTAQTTLDVNLQQVAYNAMSGYDGAVLVMEVKTGRILACVSEPGFDPNEIQEIYDELVADEDSSALLNRAFQGLYTPGSTFKIATLLEYIRENPDTYGDYAYTCTGSITEDGQTIRCYHNKVHGSEDLMTSFANSCNASFANIGLTLDIDSFQSLSTDLLFGQDVSFELPYRMGTFSLDTDASEADLMEIAIGQGKTIVSPLQMLMIVSAIDNGGTAVQPYILESIQNSDGETVKSFSSEESYTLMSSEEAALLQVFLRDVVEEGTATALNNQSYTAYGKTGSAEYNEDGDSHAWFVGYAQQEGMEDLAVVVVMEGAGAGSSYAVPVAKAIFDAYY